MLTTNTSPLDPVFGYHVNSPLSKMWKKCFVIKSCLYFVVISLVLLFFELGSKDIYYDPEFHKVWIKKSTKEMELLDKKDEFHSRSVQSFIRASTTDNSLKGLAVYLDLTNACRTLDDVSKAKNQVHKIALVTLMQNDQTTCTLQDLAKNVQNAGYSLLIYFCATQPCRVKNSANKGMIMIPVATPWSGEWNVSEVKGIFSTADRTDFDIVCPLPCNAQQIDYLMQIESYLKRLYFWFLIGPLITLEWMRRTRKFCWMSDSQEEQRSVKSEQLKTKEMLLRMKFEPWGKVKMELKNRWPQITKNPEEETQDETF